MGPKHSIVKGLHLNVCSSGPAPKCMKLVNNVGGTLNTNSLTHTLVNDTVKPVLSGHSKLTTNWFSRWIITLCRSKVLQNALLEHSAILSTFIKLPFDLGFVYF